MGSKLYALLGLLTLTAVFASPALAVTTDFIAPAGGSTISTPTNLVVQTATPVITVEILDGSMTSLGMAVPNGDQTIWTFLLDPALHPNGSLFLNARSDDSVGGVELASPALVVTIANAPQVTWVRPANANVSAPDSLQITTDGTETNVQFSFRGSALIGTITESPDNTYTMAFDPDDYANGLGDLRADVTNANGTTQELYGINIDNTAYAPIVSAPAADAEIPLAQGILLQAITSVEQDGVEFFLDSVSIGQALEEGTVDSNDWRLQFDTSSYALGAHTISAVARNGSLFSTPTDVSVSFVDDIDPVILTYSPADGSTVSGSFGFTITTSDNVGSVSAAYSFDNSSFTPMALQGGSAFTATLDVSALPNGTTFVYVEATDARGNVGVGSVGFNVANPQAPTLNTNELEHFGSTQVGGEGMYASGATATGTPTPTISYSWRVCAATPSCNNHAGQSYSPTAADIGRTVELVVRASNGVDPQDTEIVLIGTVTAADPTPTPTPEPTPEPTPAPAPAQPTPTPTTTTPVTTPPVVTPPVVGPTVTTIVNSSSAPQKVTGTAGPDRVVTGSGSDVIRTGAGADVISPGKGGGFVSAGPGNDVIRALASKGLIVHCGTGKDVLFANRTTQSVGCEKIVVASNGKLVTVKAGADKLPVMPANFNGPYALAPKAPVVIAADQKVAAAKAVLVKKDAAVLVAEKKDATAVKAVVVATPMLATAVKAVAVDEKQIVLAERALAAAQAKMIIALKTKKGVAEARAAVDLALKSLDAARSSVTAAAKKVVVAETKVIAAAKTLVETKTGLVAAVTLQKTAASTAVLAKKDVVVATQDVLAEKKTAVKTLATAAVAAVRAKIDAERDLRAVAEASAHVKLRAAFRLSQAQLKAAALHKALEAAKAVLAEATPKVVQAQKEVAVATKTVTQLAAEAKALAGQQALAAKRKLAAEEAAAALAKRTAALATVKAAAVKATHAVVVAMYEQRDAEKDLSAARDSSSEIRLRLGMRVMKARDHYLRASKVSDLAVAARDAAVKAYDLSVAGS